MNDEMRRGEEEEGEEEEKKKRRDEEGGVQEGFKGMELLTLSLELGFLVWILGCVGLMVICCTQT